MISLRQSYYRDPNYEVSRRINSSERASFIDVIKEIEREQKMRENRAMVVCPLLDKHNLVFEYILRCVEKDLNVAYVALAEDLDTIEIKSGEWSKKNVFIDRYDNLSPIFNIALIDCGQFNASDPLDLVEVDVFVIDISSSATVINIDLLRKLNCISLLVSSDEKFVFGNGVGQYFNNRALDLRSDSGIGSYLIIKESVERVSKKEGNMKQLSVIKERVDKIYRVFNGNVVGRAMVRVKGLERITMIGLMANLLNSVGKNEDEGLILSTGSDLELLIRFMKRIRPDLKFFDHQVSRQADVSFSALEFFKNFKEEYAESDLAYIVINIGKPLTDYEIIKDLSAYFRCRLVIMSEDDKVFEAVKADSVLPNFYDYIQVYESLGKGATVVDSPLLSIEYVGESKATELKLGSNAKHNWRCLLCGSVYPMNVILRRDGYYCPDCTLEQSRQRKITDPKHCSVLSYSKVIADEYVENFTNPEIGVESLLASSGDKVGWQCGYCGENYKRTPHERVKGINCPHCSAERAGETRSKTATRNNNLTNHPNLLNAFRGTVNKEGEIDRKADPGLINPFFDIVCLWQCACGKEYQSTAYQVRHGTIRCERCNKAHSAKQLANNRKHLESVADLPYSDELIEVIDTPYLNKNNTSSTSKKSANWKCSVCGKLFTATVLARRLGKAGCDCEGALKAPPLLPEQARIYRRRKNKPTQIIGKGIVTNKDNARDIYEKAVINPSCCKESSYYQLIISKLETESEYQFWGRIVIDSACCRSGLEVVLMIDYLGQEEVVACDCRQMPFLCPTCDKSLKLTSMFFANESCGSNYQKIRLSTPCCLTKLNIQLIMESAN